MHADAHHVVREHQSLPAEYVVYNELDILLRREFVAYTRVGIVETGIGWIDYEYPSAAFNRDRSFRGDTLARACKADFLHIVVIIGVAERDRVDELRFAHHDRVHDDCDIHLPHTTLLGHAGQAHALHVRHHVLEVEGLAEEAVRRSLVLWLVGSAVPVRL